MIIFVVVFNVLLSLICLYVAWQLWNLRLALAITADIVALFERDTYNALHGAPNAISQGQLGVSNLRVSYQQLEIQLQRVQQILALLGLAQRVLRIAVRSSIRLNQRNQVDRLLRRSQLRRLRRQRRSRK
ncbi:MAG: hypothetical protein AB1589_21125 [Cyanobacteriota bacterium]